MRKRVISVLLCISMAAVMIAGCNSPSKAEGKERSKKEKKVVRIALEPSSHVFTVIAEEQGFLAEEGIEAEMVPCENYEDAFTALAAGKIDVLTNYGTNLPLQYIGKGTDITIFGGNMITGCMPIIAKADTKWEKVDDFIGTKIASMLVNYQISGPLLDKGYDPAKEVEWLPLPTMTDRVAAVKSGEADFAVLSTGFTYQVQQDKSLKVVAFSSDILPNYSCCRVEANTKWINENKDTVKSLLKSWIRAQQYYEGHKEETIKLVAKTIDAPEEYVAAYVNNEHYQLNVDPYKKSVLKAWDYLGKLGGLEKGYEDIDIESHINTDIYKAALDECVKEYYDDDPAFYDSQLKIYEENN